MAGLGIQADRHALIDGQEAIFLSVSDVSEGIDAGVTQRVYADNTQRAIIGYATQSAYTLTIQRLVDADYEWMRRRVGQRVVWRDLNNTLAAVIVGNLTRTRVSRRSDTQVWNAKLSLFLIAANINEGLPTDEDIEELQR